MRYTVRVVPEREHWVPELAAQIPGLEVIRDRSRNVHDTFLMNLLQVGEDAAVYLEDDIILTSNFVEKIEAEIARRPHMLIQFFTLRDDADKGPRLMAASTFMMNQCFYMPARYAMQIYDHFPRWSEGKVRKSGVDMLIQNWLKARRERYWLHTPSLVQHRVAKSVIDPHRSSKRQSPTFVA